LEQLEQLEELEQLEKRLSEAGRKQE
jgi:hypothetical protein